jgi:GAF domain-containing protein
VETAAEPARRSAEPKPRSAAVLEPWSEPEVRARKPHAVVEPPAPIKKAERSGPATEISKQARSPRTKPFTEEATETALPQKSSTPPAEKPNIKPVLPFTFAEVLKAEQKPSDLPPIRPSSQHATRILVPQEAIEKTKPEPWLPATEEMHGIPPQEEVKSWPPASKEKPAWPPTPQSAPSTKPIEKEPSWPPTPIEKSDEWPLAATEKEAEAPAWPPIFASSAAIKPAEEKPVWPATPLEKPAWSPVYRPGSDIKAAEEKPAGEKPVWPPPFKSAAAPPAFEEKPAGAQKPSEDTNWPPTSALVPPVSDTRPIEAKFLAPWDSAVSEFPAPDAPIREQPRENLDADKKVETTNAPDRVSLPVAPIIAAPIATGAWDQSVTHTDVPPTQAPLILPGTGPLPDEALAWGISGTSEKSAAVEAFEMPGSRPAKETIVLRNSAGSAPAFPDVAALLADVPSNQAPVDSMTWLPESNQPTVPEGTTPVLMDLAIQGEGKVSNPFTAPTKAPTIPEPAIAPQLVAATANAPTPPVQKIAPPAPIPPTAPRPLVSLQSIAFQDDRRGMRVVDRYSSSPESNRAMSSGEIVQRQPDGGSGDQSSVLAIPIHIQDNVLGVLEFSDDSGHRQWTDEDRMLAEEITDQLALALENARLFHQAAQRTEELALINRVVSSVAGSLDLRSSLDVVAIELAHALSLEHASISLLSEDKTTLTLVSDQPAQTERTNIGVFVTVKDSAILSRALDAKKPSLITDLDTNPLRPSVAEEGISSGKHTLLILPLIAEGETIGLVGLHIQEEGRTFSPDDMRLAETIVVQASTAIQNARLHTQTESALRDAVTLFQTSQRLQQATNESSLLRAALESCKMAVSLNSISIQQFGEEIGQAYVMQVAHLADADNRPWKTARASRGCSTRFSIC